MPLTIALRPVRLPQAAIVAGALMLGLVIGLHHLRIGPFSEHMLQHILGMNAVAPVAAFVLLKNPRMRRFASRGGLLVGAAVGQIVFLWGWHTPIAFQIAHASAMIMALMHITLFGSAVVFWMSVIETVRTAPWLSVMALLVTGKLFCLYGALLIFAPRALFAAEGQSGHSVSMDDQHLAGLIMVTACPLTYVAAAVFIVARWIKQLETSDAASRGL